MQSYSLTPTSFPPFPQIYSNMFPDTPAPPLSWKDEREGGKHWYWIRNDRISPKGTFPAPFLISRCSSQACLSMAIFPQCLHPSVCPFPQYVLSTFSARGTLVTLFWEWGSLHKCFIGYNPCLILRCISECFPLSWYSCWMSVGRKLLNADTSFNIHTNLYSKAGRMFFKTMLFLFLQYLHCYFWKFPITPPLFQKEMKMWPFPSSPSLTLSLEAMVAKSLLSFLLPDFSKYFNANSHVDIPMCSFIMFKLAHSSFIMFKLAHIWRAIWNMNLRTNYEFVK